MALIDLQSYHDTTALQDGESDAQVADTGNTSNNTAADDSHAEYLKRFTPNVTADDIAAVRNLSSTDKDELKRKIKFADPSKIFLPDRQGKGFICPTCDNGSGSDGDGIKPTLTNDGYIFHCFKSSDCEGDLLNIIAQFNFLDTKKDFSQILAIGKKIVETAYSGNFADIDISAASITDTSADDAQISMLNQAFFSQNKNNFGNVPSEYRRGLTVETLTACKIFYSENWTNPKFFDSRKRQIPTPRIIIPTSYDSYLAVTPKQLRNNDHEKYWKINAGKKHLLNLFDKDKCAAPIDTLIVVEGEFDNLSIWQATNHKYLTLSIGGTSNYKKLLDFVNEKKKNFSEDFIVIILLDADNAGRKAAKQATDLLKSKGYSAFDCLIDNELDANDFLIKHGDASLSARIDEIVTDAKSKLPAIKSEMTAAQVTASDTPSDDVKFTTTKSKIPSCPIDLIIPGGYGFDEYCIAFQGKPITTTPVVPTRILKTYGTGEYLVELAYYTVHNKKWHGGIVVGKEILVDKNKVIQLAKYNVNVNSSTAKSLAIYFSEIIDFWRNRAKLITLPTYRQTGWYKDSDGKYFFVNSATSEKYLIKRSGWNFNDILTPKGDYDKQLAMFNSVADKGGVAARFTLGAALLAPMVKPLELSPNVQIHLHGDRGQGKTPLAEFAVSLFADPSANGLQKTFQASNKNLYELPTAFNDLPVLVDELETMTQKRRETELPLLIYDYSFGVGRQIQRKDGTQREVDRYSGTRITTGESQMLSVNDKSGNFKRIIQYLCKNLFDNDFSIELHKFCGKNYGNIGKRWIELLTDAYNDTAKLQKLKDSHDSVLDRIRKRDNRTAIYEHTNIQTVAKCLFAYYLFKADLNIDEVDLKALDKDADEIISTLPTRNDIDDTTRAVDCLKSVVNSYRAHFFKQSPNDDSTDQKLPNEIYGFIYDTGAVAFYPHILRRLLEKELGFQSTDKLLEEFKAKGFISCSKNRGYCRYVKDLRTHVSKKRQVDVYYFAPNILLTSDDDSTVDDSAGSYGNDDDSTVDEDSDNEKRFKAICGNITAVKADEFYYSRNDTTDKDDTPSYVEPDDDSTPF